MSVTHRSIGVLAGHGEYPHLLVSRLIASGHAVVVAALEGQFDRSFLSRGAEPLKICYFPVGAIRRQAEFFRTNRALQCYFAGGVHWRGVWKHVSLDRYSAKVLLGTVWRGDDHILRSVAEQFERLGIAVEDPKSHIADLFLPQGIHAGTFDDEELMNEIRIGWRAAKELGRRDLGQGVVVHGGRTAGVESRRGTDAMIASAPGPGAVLVKVAKPGQDHRFDLPVIGPRTVRLAAAVGMRAIAVEAGAVMVVQKETVFELCRRKGVALVALDDDCGLPRSPISTKKESP